MPHGKKFLLLALGCFGAVCAHASTVARSTPEPSSLERGKYVVQLGGCNDCHTAGYAQSGGKVPVERWLLGNSLGFSGPWGTTYPANLRLTLKDMTEAQWLVYARSLESRPPMPSFTLHVMTDADLRDMYRFIKSLGVSEERAPGYVPPGTAPVGPHVVYPGGKS
jgi:mono/diheme cytochrome c family protein